MKRSSIWKLVGLAGLAGLAATGVVVARSERQRRSYTPEEVRARLHDRLASMEGASATAIGPGPTQLEHPFGLAGRFNAWHSRRAERRSHRV